MTYFITGIILLAIMAGVGIFLSMLFRKVVPTNEVHIVQKKDTTVSYGKSTENGNVYYKIPSWVPFFGIEVSKLPVSNFDIDLSNYEAYDSGRLPFLVDIKAFFRVTDSNLAAERVSTVEELYSQLEAMVQGATRAVLSGMTLDEIMSARSTIGKAFTDELTEGITNWGVEPVRNLELMDLRDAKGSNVIHNIMEKKKSEIEKDSRVAVANNNREAELAEVEAKKEIDLKKQDMTQQVGLRKVEAEQKVQLAEETKKQLLSEQLKLTTEKEMAVRKVKEVKDAEIKNEIFVLNAENKKKTAVLDAEAKLEQERKAAEGVQAKGEAEAAAKKALELAPIQAQIELAKEIGQNKDYQAYLIQLDQIKATQAVGEAQAAALEKAQIKIIANTGDAPSGIKSVSDLFSSKGGTQVAAALEGFVNSDLGKKIVDKALGTDSASLN